MVHVNNQCFSHYIVLLVKIGDEAHLHSPLNFFHYLALDWH